MPGPRHQAILDSTLLGITALLMLGGFIALGFLQNLSKENRALLIMISSLGIIGCLAGFIFIGAFRKWLRRRTWQRAMAAWKESSEAEITSKLDITGHLSEDGLRKLAIQVYSRVGYRIPNAEDQGGYLQLLNPDGKIELFACKQRTDSIKLHHIYSLQLEMKRTKAVRGFFWAPAGFTNEATDWVVHKPIVLADQNEIRRLVDCAQTKGSRFLEY